MQFLCYVPSINRQFQIESNQHSYKFHATKHGISSVTKVVSYFTTVMYNKGFMYSYKQHKQHSNVLLNPFHGIFKKSATTVHVDALPTFHSSQNSFFQCLQWIIEIVLKQIHKHFFFTMAHQFLLC